MIVFYDAAGEPQAITDYLDYYVTHMLDGCDKLSFCLDVRHEQYKMLYEEARIVANGNEWLIKQIDDDRIDCELNFDFLKTTFYKDFDSGSLPLVVQLERHLPEGWTVSGANVSSISRTIKFDYCTDYDIVYQCMATYGVYFVWDIPRKRLTVYSKEMMQSTGEYLTSELNLRSLSFKGDTTEFCTRLYAFGEGGMTMEDAIVDGQRYGLTYVENKSYIDKVVCAYWTDDRYTVPENLYAAAVKQLETLSYPVRSYECNVIDLAKQNPDYSFLDFKMHKKVTLIDTDRGIRVEHQIVEYREYPDEPEHNVVTLSSVPQTIKTTITSAVSTLEEASDKMQTAYEQRIAMATAMLTGAFGGYTYANESEFFILDNPDPAQALTVWRWNINGFGKSSTGIDGPYTTAITFDDNFVTSVITAMVIRGAYIEAGSIQTEALSQSYKASVTDEITGECNEVRQEFHVAEGELYSEISKKVDNTEFGTKLVQNWESVQISWNSISRYVSFEDASLRIYEDNEQHDMKASDLLMSLSQFGIDYYCHGDFIGTIGTSEVTYNGVTRKGLEFDLDSATGFMSWTSNGFVKVAYWNDSGIAAQGFHVDDNVYFMFDCDISGSLTVCGISCDGDLDMNGHDILNESDARLKTNIAPAEVDALDVVNGLNVMSFDWIKTGKHCDAGVVAQQVKQVLPELVAESEETGKLSVKLNLMIPYMLKAIQELSDRVDELEGKKPKKRSFWKDRFGSKSKGNLAEKIGKMKQERIDKKRPVVIPQKKDRSDKAFK